MALNDLKKTSLKALGYSGSLNDMEVAFWKQFAPTKFEYNDLKRAWLAANGFNQLALNDAYNAYLKSLGYTGSLNDKEYKAASAGLLYFSPRSLFLAGEQGAWYDPSDFATLFQDSAGTTPVTAVGQPVGRMLDKSGKNNHVIQATAASRPVLQQDGNGKYYLACDGVDDGMVTSGNVDFTATAQMTVCMGQRKLSDAAFGALVELSANLSSNNGSFIISAPDSAASNYRATFKGTVSNGVTITSFAAPDTAVLTAAFDIAAPLLQFRRNGVLGASSTTTAGTGTFGNYPLYLFRRGGVSNPFNGNFYGGVIRGATSNALQVSQLEKYMGAKTGVTI